VDMSAVNHKFLPADSITLLLPVQSIIIKRQSRDSSVGRAGDL
jgi:hypothetical protein